MCIPYLYVYRLEIRAQGRVFSFYSQIPYTTSLIPEQKHALGPGVESRGWNEFIAHSEI